MKRLAAPLCAAAALIAAGAASAHYDHPAPDTAPPTEPVSTTVNAGGDNASWELLATIPTGNPHSDLDFFTQKGEMFASVGTLAVGPNAGGQTIVQLTQSGAVAPKYIGGHPSAACASATTSATGLQHDVEATPKGDVIFNAPNPYVVPTRDAQLLLDATDATGRCHDNGTFGAQGAPQGGIEIIDITDPVNPAELALISHIGNAHTVNVDPKRPHIAFDVTQDGVTVGADGRRQNEVDGGTDPNDLDGFEVIDLKSCMDFPAGTPLTTKRERCRPEVYRFRYAEAGWATSHTFRSNLQSCHELEIYADDVVTCASITATLLLDLAGAFDDNGTPADFSDDKPRGKPLPCAVRDSTSAEFGTAAKVIDCVNGRVGDAAQSLRVADWLKIGAPALEGVKRIGTVHHMGFGATQDLVTAPFDSTQDIIAAHESELTGSGKYVITSDERGGGVVPGGASCSPGVDNVRGNGGLHFFPVEKFRTTLPKDAAEAQEAYAKTSTGGRAIYRAQIRTGPQATVCTAHVFQQIPGQNRIFMGYYSQGTRVLDFTENPDGTLTFKEAGWFIPENADTWTSAIFKAQSNPDGTFTYWGATGDGILTGSGRSAIDVYKVTLPAPPKPAGERKLGTPRFPGPSSTTPCARSSAFGSVRARPRGRGLAFSFSRQGKPVTVEVARVDSRGKLRRVARFRDRKSNFNWAGKRGLRRGYYVVSFRSRAADGSSDLRRVGLRLSGGRFGALGAMQRADACALLADARLSAPVIGRGLDVSFKLAEPATVRITVKRGRKVVKRAGGRAFAKGVHRLRISGRGLRSGSYKIEVRAQRPEKVSSAILSARR